MAKTRFPFALILSLLTLSALPAAAANRPISIKAVVVTMFELGDVEGDAPGEFQLWKAGQKLHTKMAFPLAENDLYLNPKTGVLGVITGVGTAKAAATITALGLDPRFDLKQAYWLIAGIAGVDPEDASVGSAAWARWVVDGDLAHHIDSREIPANWKHGYFPLLTDGLCLQCTANSQGVQNRGESLSLNRGLAEWAFELTRDIPLPDTEAARAMRKPYKGLPEAQALPKVMIGDNLSSATFWHGERNTAWANQWVKFWTNGEGNFVTSGMEDSGTVQALKNLDKAGIVDASRLMLLRTASNYSHQPQGLSAAQNLAKEFGPEGFGGVEVAVESAYAVGSRVIEEILGNWEQYHHTLPFAIEQEKTANHNPIAKVDPDPRRQRAKALASALQLEGHIEGGFFRRTFQADHRPMITTDGGDRFTMTSIYYMLTMASPVGHFHQNQSDILHFYHAGDPITYHLLHADGRYEKRVLGPNPELGHEFQFVVKGGTWKASEISADGPEGYGLISEAVAPGFDYADMRLGQADNLAKRFPAHSAVIRRLSKNTP